MEATRSRRSTYLDFLDSRGRDNTRVEELFGPRRMSVEITAHSFVARRTISLNASTAPYLQDWSKLHLIFRQSCCAPVRDIEFSRDFDLLKNRIQSFSSLQVGWDTYNGNPPSLVAINAATTVAKELEKLKILPEHVTPTSDSSILMRYRYENVWFDWEFHSDGDVAIMRKPIFNKETYHDIQATSVTEFFREQLSAQ